MITRGHSLDFFTKVSDTYKRHLNCFENPTAMFLQSFRSDRVFRKEKTSDGTCRIQFSYLFSSRRGWHLSLMTFSIYKYFPQLPFQRIYPGFFFFWRTYWYFSEINLLFSVRTARNIIPTVT